MSEEIEFIVRGRDMLSGLFPPIATRAQQTARNVDNSLLTTQQHLNDLARPVRLNVDTTGVTNASRDIESLNAGLESLSNTKLIGGMAAGQLVSQGVQASMQFVRQQITETLNAGLDASAQLAQFEVLGGKDKGGRLYSDLTKYIQDSVFGPELYKDARTLMAFGTAADDVMGTMKMLGDVAMGDKDKMAALTLAFAQTTASGKLMGQDLLQYINAGFNPLQVMAEHTGKKLGDLKDAMSDGKITADMVRQAFIWATSEGGKFHNMLDNMANTPFGIKQAMEGSIEGSKMGLGVQELPAMTQVLKEFKPIIDDLPNTLAQIKPELDAVIYGFADMVKWVRTNTDTIKMWIGLIKVGAEAYVAWKVGSAAATAANWVWVTSLGSVSTTTTEANSAIAMQNAELEEQRLAIASLIPEYEALTVSISGMSAAEKEAALAAAANTANLTLGASSLAASTRAGVVGGQAALAGGLMAGITSTAIPVAIAFFATDAIAQMMGVNNGALGYKENGEPIEWWNVWEKNNWKERYAQQEIARDKLRKNPVEYAFGWNMNDMVQAASGFNSSLLSKYGVKDPRYSPASTSASTSTAIKDVTADITGGGKKQVIINVYHELVKQLITVASKKDADSAGLMSLEEQVFRLLDSTAGAAGR